MNIILSLMITLAVEVNIYLVLNHKSFKLFATASLMNIVLNLTMNIILIRLPDLFWYLLILGIYEVTTIFVEALIIHFIFKYPFIRCLIVSTCANAASFLVGLLVYHFADIDIKKTMLLVVFIVIYLLDVAWIAYQTAKNFKKD